MAALERSKFESKKMSSVLLIRPEKNIGRGHQVWRAFEGPIQSTARGKGTDPDV